MVPDSADVFFNIAYAFRKLTRYMLNTVLVAGRGTLGMLFISSLAAYAFSKLHFPGKNIFYMAVISLMMIPGILTLVPSFMLYKSLIGLDNYMILILPQIVGPVFGVFLLRSFFEGIPEDIFEASRIDGAGEFKNLYESLSAAVIADYGDACYYADNQRME